MDRLEAMTAFVTTVDLDGMSAAARRLGKSPASITRAIDFLEERLGAQLLRRTTRTIKLTEAGAHYLAACRRILHEVAAAEQVAESERASPRGLLTVTAPINFGRLHVRPLVDRYLETHSEASVRLLLLDRVVTLIDEGVDVAFRIAHLADSSLLAVKLGEVRRILCSSPAYLAKHPRPRTPADLTRHDCISFAQITPSNVWSFRAKGGGRARAVKIRPRLSVNTADAAIGSALDGRGIACVLSYQVEAELRNGRLVELLASFAPPPIPVHVVFPRASSGSAKVRAFLDLAVPSVTAALR